VAGLPRALQTMPLLTIGGSTDLGAGVAETTPCKRRGSRGTHQGIQGFGSQKNRRCAGMARRCPIFPRGRNWLKRGRVAMDWAPLHGLSLSICNKFVSPTSCALVRGLTPSRNAATHDSGCGTLPCRAWTRALRDGICGITPIAARDRPYSSRGIAVVRPVQLCWTTDS
jgi:hypothetical protein